MEELPIIYSEIPHDVKHDQKLKPFLIENPLMAKLDEWRLDSFRETGRWCRFCYQFTDPNLVSGLQPFRLLNMLHRIGFWALKQYPIPDPQKVFLNPLLNWWRTSFLRKQAILLGFVGKIKTIREILEPTQRYDNDDFGMSSVQDRIKDAVKAFESLDQSLVALCKITREDEIQLINSILCLRSIYALTRTALQVTLDGKLSKAAADHSWCAGLYLDKELELIRNTSNWLSTLKIDDEEHYDSIEIKKVPPSSLKNFGKIKYKRLKKPREKPYEERIESFRKEFRGFRVDYEPIPLYFELAKTLNIESGSEKFEPRAFSEQVDSSKIVRGYYMWKVREEVPTGLLDDRVHEEGELFSPLNVYSEDLFYDSLPNRVIRNLTIFFFAFGISMISVVIYLMYTENRIMAIWEYPYYIAIGLLYFISHRIIKNITPHEPVVTFVISAWIFFVAVQPILWRFNIDIFG